LRVTTSVTMIRCSRVANDWGERHHRIFGYLRVDEMLSPSTCDLGQLKRPHPHTLGEWNENNTIYRGSPSGSALMARNCVRAGPLGFLAPRSLRRVTQGLAIGFISRLQRLTK